MNIYDSMHYLSNKAPYKPKVGSTVYLAKRTEVLSFDDIVTGEVVCASTKGGIVGIELDDHKTRIVVDNPFCFKTRGEALRRLDEYHTDILHAEMDRFLAPKEALEKLCSLIPEEMTKLASTKAAQLVVLKALEQAADRHGGQSGEKGENEK